MQRFRRVAQGYIRDRMQAGYDAEYLRQIFDFIVYIVSCMEAPARIESTQKVWPLHPSPYPTLSEGIRGLGAQASALRIWRLLRAVAQDSCGLRGEHPCEPSRELGFQVQLLFCRVMRRC